MQHFLWIPLLFLGLIVRSSGLPLGSSFGKLHQVGFRTLDHDWGAYAPFYPVKRYEPPPTDCTITQVGGSLSYQFGS